MGWYGAWRLIQRHGGAEQVPDSERRSFLHPEADPGRTWELAKAAARGEWPGGQSTIVADQEGGEGRG